MKKRNSPARIAFTVLTVLILLSMVLGLVITLFR